MKLLWLSILLCCGSIAAAQNLTLDEIRIKEIKEKILPQAYKDQNTQVISNLLADEYWMIDADGNSFGKNQELAHVQSHKPTYESHLYTIGRLLIFDETTAILNGMGIIIGADDEGSYTTTYQSSDVMIKRDGDWQAISTHVSGLRTNYTGDGD